MAQSYNGDSTGSIGQQSSIGATSAPPMASPSPLRRTRGGRLLAFNFNDDEESSRLDPKKIFSPCSSRPPIPVRVTSCPHLDDTRDETLPRQATMADARDEIAPRQAAMTDAKDKILCEAIPFPKMKSLSAPIRIKGGNSVNSCRKTRTTRCARTIDENSVLLDEDILALQQYIDELDILDDSTTCASEIQDAIVNMVLSDVGELPHAVSSMSASYWMAEEGEDDDSIDSLEADLASKASSGGIIVPPCLSKGSHSALKSIALPETADESSQKQAKTDLQSENESNVESSTTLEETPEQEEVPQALKNESIPNPVMAASQKSASACPDKVHTTQSESLKETAPKLGIENEVKMSLTSNSTISTVPSTDRYLSRISSLSSMSSTVLDEVQAGSASDESKESGVNSSSSDMDNIQPVVSSFDSEAGLSTQWDIMLETISQKLFVPAPGQTLAANQEREESNRAVEGHVESFCSTFATHIRSCFVAAKAPSAGSDDAAEQVNEKRECVELKETKHDVGEATTASEKAPLGVDANNLSESAAAAADSIKVDVTEGADAIGTVHESSKLSEKGVIHDVYTSCVCIGGNASRLCCGEEVTLKQFVCRNEVLNCNPQEDIINLTGPSLSSISMNSLSATPGGFGQGQAPKQIPAPKHIISKNATQIERPSGCPPLAPKPRTSRWRKVLNMRRNIPTVGKTKGRSFGSGIKTM